MNSDDRRSARANVILTGMIEHLNSRIPVRIRDLSEHGAQVIGDKLPAPDTQITLRCNGKAVDGWVAWSRGERAGIEFGEPTPPEGQRNGNDAQVSRLLRTRERQNFGGLVFGEISCPMKNEKSSRNGPSRLENDDGPD